MALASHMTRRPERGNAGNSRGSCYIYYDLFVLVLLSPYVSIVIIDLTLSCESVRLSLIDYHMQCVQELGIQFRGPREMISFI